MAYNPKITERKNISILDNAEVCWHHKCHYNRTRLPIALNKVLMCVEVIYVWILKATDFSVTFHFTRKTQKVYKSKLQSIEDIRGKNNKFIQIFRVDEKIQETFYSGLHYKSMLYQIKKNLILSVPKSSLLGKASNVYWRLRNSL